MRRQSLRPIARRALAAQSDERLVGLVRDGHEPAFEEIVRRYRGPLVTFATAIVSHNRAEDVVQGSLAKAHRALLGEPKEIALRPWLFTIVRNAALNVIRDEPYTDELPSDYPAGAGPAAIAEQHEELDRLVLAICSLPSGQREALVRRELEGAGHAEIASQLGTSTTAVRGLIFRARTSLRDAVGALVPLPLLRQLLMDGSRMGTAAEAASGGAGIGAAVIGAAGAKGGVALTAAVLALATGVAIEHDRGDGNGQASAAVRAAGAERSPDVTRTADQAGGSTGSAGSVAATAAGGGTTEARLKDRSEGAGSDRPGGGFSSDVGSIDSNEGAGQSSSGSGDGGHGVVEQDPGSGEGGGEGPGHGTQGSGGSGSGGSGSEQGPGGGSGEGSSGPPPSETPGEGSGSGGGGSGSGSGHGEIEATDPEATIPLPLPHDGEGDGGGNSGPGGDGHLESGDDG